jgi:hypothetical protein
LSEDNSQPGTEPAEAEETPLDPAQVQFLNDRLASEQNLGLAVGAGAGAAVAGAAAWAAITVVTEYQIGFMAIGVGFLVGYAVRIAGKGVSTPFGVVGAVFSLIGCGLGNLLTVSAFIAADEGVGIFEVLAQLDLDATMELMVATFSPIDLLFYAIAVYYGYSVSFRQVSAEDLGWLGGDA